MRRLTLLLILFLGLFPEATRCQQATVEQNQAGTSGAQQPQEPTAAPSLPASAPAPALPASASEPPAEPIKNNAQATEGHTKKIGRVHDNLRRSKAAREAVRGANTLYDRYSDFKNQLGRMLVFPGLRM